MTIASLERRIAKMEAKSHGDSPTFFLIWATPGSDLKAPIAAAIKAGRCTKGDPAFCFPWRGAEPIPAARWTTVHKISDAEVTAIGDHQLAEYERGIMEGRNAPFDRHAPRHPDIMLMNDREVTAAMMGLYVASYDEYRGRSA